MNWSSATQFFVTIHVKKTRSDEFCNDTVIINLCNKPVITTKRFTVKIYKVLRCER